jgi:hypothetical protein
MKMNNQAITTRHGLSSGPTPHHSRRANGIMNRRAWRPWAPKFGSAYTATGTLDYYAGAYDNHWSQGGTVK